MKNIYKLTDIEFWALGTLAYLPIENGSIIAQWLTQFEPPSVDGFIDGAIKSLEAKGYIDPQRGQDIIPEDLLEAFMVLSISSVRLTVAIQRNGKFTWTYFGQLEETVVQYEITDNTIQVHSPDQAYELSAMLVPEWFRVDVREDFTDTLPFGTYLMLVTAFQMHDIQSVLVEDDASPAISRKDLYDAFMESQEWVDIYHAIGFSGIQPVSQMPFDKFLQLLIQQDYLHQIEDDLLQIGSGAFPLRTTYSDPDLCTLTLSLDGTGADFPRTGVLIYGSGRLFLIQVSETFQFAIRQLDNLHAALGWSSSLIAKGAAVQPTLPNPPEIQMAELISVQPSVGDQLPHQVDITATTQPKKKRRVWLIVLVAVLLVICCSCSLFFYEDIMYLIEEILWSLGIL